MMPIRSTTWWPRRSWRRVQSPTDHPFGTRNRFEVGSRQGKEEPAKTRGGPQPPPARSRKRISVNTLVLVDSLRGSSENPSVEERLRGCRGVRRAAREVILCTLAQFGLVKRTRSHSPAPASRAERPSPETTTMRHSQVGCDFS